MAAKVYVCSNQETLRDGYVSEPEAYSDQISMAVSEAMRLLDDAGCDSQSAGFFKDWHGGKKYGYRCGWVATLEVDPSAEVIAAIDAADTLLTERLTAIGKQEEADQAAAAAEEAE